MACRAFDPMSAGRTLNACAALLMALMARAQAMPQRTPDRPGAPVVLVVGCAGESAQPHIWTLSHAGERSESLRAGITAGEKAQLAQRPLGQDAYQLIGVADFVAADTSRTIGVRGEILPPSRVNATGMLASGHKIAVKGLYIQASPARINLTSVVDLGRSCP
jgi:hypothetical protein